MASESARIQVRQNEVLLFKNGQPVLRVQQGTTLSVIKLLYQADPRNKGTVIALRPETDDPLPCLLTLDQSALEEAKYEIITHEPSLENYSNLTNGNAEEIRELPKLVCSRFPQSKVQEEVTPEASDAILQREKTASHAIPLTINVSPEGNPKHLANQRKTGSSSSLLLARSNNGFFSSHSGVLLSSRRKKTSRKYAFPHRVLPNSSADFGFADLAGKYLVHRRSIEREGTAQVLDSASTSNTVGYGVTSEAVASTESVDSPGVCDSTENGSNRIAEEINLSVQHRRENCDRNVVAPFSVDDSAGYSNCPTLETCSTNDSSPAVSEEHPAIIDIHSDSRETSGGENDSDSNFVNGDSSPPRDHAAMSHGTHSVRIDRLQKSTEKMECSNDSTPIVLLQSSVQIKTDPSEVFETANDSSPVPKMKKVSISPQGDNAEHQDARHHIHSEGYSVIMPTSSPEVHSNSVPVHQVSPLMPHVVEVVGASPDHTEQSDSSHHHNCNDRYEDGKEHSCDICHKQFDSALSVTRHKRSHTGDRPYICKICGWGFNLSGNLNQHLAIHQKVKPFKCVYCGKTFARSNVLKAHVRCHTGERPYQCHLCGSKFIIGHNLKKHMLTRHGIREDDKLYSQNIDGPDDNNPQPSEQSENSSIPMLQS